MEKLRRVEILALGNWFELEEGLEALNEGSIFRMYEPDGKEVRDRSGNTVFQATGEPYPTKQGKGIVWAVDMVPHEV